VLGSILQVFLAEPLGEWQQERKALMQLAAAAAESAGTSAAEGAEAGASGSAAAAAAGDEQGGDVADLKVRVLCEGVRHCLMGTDIHCTVELLSNIQRDSTSMQSTVRTLQAICWCCPSLSHAISARKLPAALCMYRRYAGLPADVSPTH
jgi:hypothetical protein